MQSYLSILDLDASTTVDLKCVNFSHFQLFKLYGHQLVLDCPLKENMHPIYFFLIKDLFIYLFYKNK